MDKYYDILYKTIWSEYFWLPPNITWADLDSRKDIHVAKAKELWCAFPIAIGLFIARLIWERFLALPLGRYFNIKETAPLRAQHNDYLENAFRKHRRVLPAAQVEGMAKQLDWPTRRVERWWRRRRIQDKPNEMQRWKETTWRFTFYICAFWYGMAILWDKPWMWDTKHCWYGYPYQDVTPDMWWYYMIELGFYCSLILSLFMDNKRKDFLEMIIHHVATISLLVFSWANNMVRLGTLVLVIHDAVDYWMEGAKLAKYAKFHKLCDILFVIFTLVWFITRIVIYPLRILWSSLVVGQRIIGQPVGIYYFNNTCLITLYILHVIWFYIIVKMLRGYVLNGQVEKDDRSETEESESNTEEAHLPLQTNGAQDGEIDVTVRNRVNNNEKLMMNCDMQNGSKSLPAARSKIPMRQSASKQQ